jgi:hypothetical protein
MDNITLNTLSLEPRILHVMFRGVWTWSDLDSFIQRSVILLNETEVPLYVVADLTESAELPPSILVRGYSILSNSPANLRQTIIVTNNNFVEGIIATFRYVFNKYQRAVAVAGSRDEAVNLIMSHTGSDNN